jgi:hypothetical protein
MKGHMKRNFRISSGRTLGELQLTKIVIRAQTSTGTEFSAPVITEAS